MNIDYTNRNDLIEFSISLNDLSDDEKANILSDSIVSGLMKPPLLFRIIGWFLTKDFLRKSYYQLFVRSTDDLIEEAWEENMDHMIDGEDCTDPKSGGGWNADELAQFIKIVEKYTV